MSHSDDSCDRDPSTGRIEQGLGGGAAASESAPLFGGEARAPRGPTRAFLAAMCCALVLGALLGFASGGPEDSAAASAVPVTTAAMELASNGTLALTAAEPSIFASKSKDKEDRETGDEEEKKTWKSTKAAPLSAPNAFTEVCEDPNYTKVTLKTATESTMVSLFADLRGEKKFEASDVIFVGNDFLVVYDNLWEIGRIEQNLEFRGSKNTLIPAHKSREGESGFEALVYAEEKSMFYVVIEAISSRRNPYHEAKVKHASDSVGGAIKTNENEKKSSGDKDNDARSARTDSKDESYHAVIEELRMPFLLDDKKSAKDQQDETYTLHDRCATEFTFSSENKGFEGAVHVLHEGESILIGLCEGNYCEGGERGRKEGNGRLVLMSKREANHTHACVWETRSVLALPPTAAFADYSAIALLEANTTAMGPQGNGQSHQGSGKHHDADPNGRHREFHLAVTSQESSQVWTGRLRTSNKRKDLSDWSLTDGVVYNFPRNDQCEIEYCNIEGISFLDDNLLVAVSDKMKSGGKQHYRCLRKDQSIHTFVLP